MIVRECCLEVLTRFCSSCILRQSSTLIVYLYFSSTLAFMFFRHAKEHDRTTTKRIQDNRLRVKSAVEYSIEISSYRNDNLSSASFTAITRVARHAGDSYSQFLLSFIILVELNHSLNALAEYIKVKILIG